MKTKIIGLLLIVAFIGNGCTGVLDTPPTQHPSEEVFWGSKEDFEMALTGCYSYLQQRTLSNGLVMYDCMVDNGYTGSTGEQSLRAGQIQMGQTSPEMTGLVPDLYAQAYKVIVRMNIFLERLDAYEEGDITDEYRRQLIGEVLFMRSYAYWMLYLHYGEVPVVTEVLTIENQIQPKASKADVYKQIYSDLQTCITYLPDITYVAANGHATRGAARGLLARLLMFEAYNDSGNIDPALAQEAYDQLDQITGYTLHSSYEDMFRPAGQEGCPEIIFSIKYLAPNSYHDADRQYGEYTLPNPVDNLFNAYEAGDIRRDLTIASGGTYTWPGGDEITLPINTTKKNLVKWVRPVMNAEDMWSGADRSDVDFIILRWGELLLLKAEAANELNKTEEAIRYVNEVRVRAGLDEIPLTTGKDVLREYIRHERRVETAFEGIRIYDLKRWRMMEILNGIVLDENLSEGYRPSYNPAHFYFPLPFGEIEKSQGILIQNPNYR